MSLAALGRLSENPAAVCVYIIFGRGGAEDRQGQVHLAWFWQRDDLTTVGKWCRPVTDGGR